MNQTEPVFFLSASLPQLIPPESRTWEHFYIYISHIQNSLAALSEVQINPSEEEEYTLQILASNEV